MDLQNWHSNPASDFCRVYGTTSPARVLSAITERCVEAASLELPEQSIEAQLMDRGNRLAAASTLHVPLSQSQLGLMSPAPRHLLAAA